tara:strand:+ start:319 stop:543 length:225 start_codon:yes stop_codon:yes gene_type:complete
MKYIFLILIFFITSCSLNNDIANLINIPIKKTIEKNEITKILEKTNNFNSMTFDEFGLFLKYYSNETDYPDINK